MFNDLAIATRRLAAAILFTGGRCLLTVLLAYCAYAADGSVDLQYSGHALRTSGVEIAVVQPDGKIIIGGYFTAVNGLPRTSVARLNQDGSLDTSFVTGITGPVRSISLQVDGKIVVGGGTLRIGAQFRHGINRLEADGSPDLGFFNSGQGTSGANNLVYVTALQSDGKILIGGQFDNVNGSIRSGLARLNADGSVDTGFVAHVGGDNRIAYAVTIMPNGQIMVGGNFSMLSDSAAGNVGRINADGSRDAGFTATAGSIVSDFELVPGDKVLMVGMFSQVNGVNRQGIVRLDAGGAIDPTFTSTLININSVPRATLQPDGKLMLTGNLVSVNGVSKQNLARLNGDGTLDASFTATADSPTTSVAIHNGQAVVTGFFTKLNAVDRFAVGRIDLGTGSTDAAMVAGVGERGAVRRFLGDSSGRILVGGTFTHFGTTSFKNIARLNADGSADQTFQTGTGFSGGGDRVNDMILVDAGQIIVAGSFSTYNGVARRALVALNDNGTLNAGFNANLTSTSEVRRVASLNGKILISGFFGFGGSPSGVAVALLNPDGSRDLSFQPVFTGGTAALAMPTADGKIIVSGTFTSVNGTGRSFVARLNMDGSVDTSFTYSTPGYNMGGGTDVIPLPDGKLYLVGPYGRSDNSGSTPVLRLLPSGSRDTGFNAPIRDFLLPIIAVQQDGRLLCFQSSPSTGSSRMVVRFKANGAFDYSFWNSSGVDNFATVQTIAVLPNQKVLVGGDFTASANVPRLSAVKLENDLEPPPGVFDFDGDGKTDLGVFRPLGAASEWWINRSSNGSTLAFQFGTSTDLLAPADHTLDGHTDIALFRPSSGLWYVLRSEDFSFYAFPFGTSGDIPLPADYDGDGRPDHAVYRPSSSTWFIHRSGSVGTRIVQFGSSGDHPIVGDFDGDNSADIGIFRPSVGEWWINRSSDGLLALQFGSSADKPVPGDYTGDGKSDVAFWRPSTGEWFVLRSEDFSFFAFPFGTTGDIPAPGDYDGDGKFDATVFRPSNATWYSQRSTAGTLIQQFGATGDRPIPNAFVP